MEVSAKDFLRQINALFTRVGAVEEIKKQMVPKNMNSIINNFNEFDPFVQASFIVCVIHMNEKEFDSIKNDYSELIKIGKESSIDWVCKFSNIFENYPSLEVIHDIDFSSIYSLEDAIPSMLESKRYVVNPNFRVDVIKPPSINFHNPTSFKDLELESENKKKALQNTFYSEPPRKIRHITDFSSIPPRAKTKPKTIHEITEIPD